MWFAATAFCAAAGVVISVYTAVQTPGRFPYEWQRALNTFAFFTIQSNLIVGATTLLLAVRPDRSSMVFRVFRLIGLVSITVTGLVYHVALSRLLAPRPSTPGSRARPPADGAVRPPRHCAILAAWSTTTRETALSTTR